MTHPVLARGRRLLLYLAAWLPFAAAGGAFLGASRPGAWAAGLALGGVATVAGAFLVLGAWYPAVANPVGATPFGRLLSVHGAAIAVSTLLWLAVVAWLARALGTHATFAGMADLLRANLPILSTAFALVFALAIVASYLVVAQGAARAAERRALQLQVAAREAELKALRAQLDPHFLFNALNSLAALCGSDGTAARGMIEQLAVFLRRNLELTGQERIRLGRELELALAYLQIERVRFGDRLRFLHEADRTAEEATVPPLILQPLVENAVKHGIAHLLDGGTVEISARRRGDTLYVVVENPCDPDRPTSRGTELGLENVRRRLEAAYGERALLATERRVDRFRAEVRVPVDPTAPEGRPETR